MLLPVALWPGFLEEIQLVAPGSPARTACFWRKGLAAKWFGICSPWKVLHPWWQQWDRGAHPAHPPVLLVLLSHPQLPRLGLKAPHNAVVLSAFVGGFSKCNSSGSGVGVAGSGPCQAHLLQGSVDTDHSVAHRVMCWGQAASGRSSPLLCIFYGALV